MVHKIDKIETERLLLRGIDESDAETIVLWRSVSNVYKYFKASHQISLDEHLNWYWNRYLSNNDRFDWMCIERKDKQRIGVFGMVRKGDKAEVNYLLAPEAQHKGYASEAIQNMIGYAQKKWNTKQIVAEIHEEKYAFYYISSETWFQINI